ncbi:hypothetical protein IFM89_007120 [Coptis chinensis]|uniref:RING-type E3 ubiquitin transferase n=1 Tax=Coptis chinensis TaxID=261450 RepID=A0A835HCZ6_9MAGN|nr:hypothetical protein IFM89_007120 [Coptis chinensis]
MPRDGMFAISFLRLFGGIAMGAFCCCPCGEDTDEYSYPSSSIYRHCICLRYFLHQLLSGYSAMFHRLDERSIASPIQGTTSLTATELGTASDNSLNAMYFSVPRPMPYDADQRPSRLQRDGLVFRREKSSSNFQEESQPLRRSGSSSGVEPMVAGKKWIRVDSEEECKIGSSESSEKNVSAKVSQGLAYTFPPPEDEDVCPTCLDEYTPENPKIITRCSHHFHLGCIYEWMERSETCPLCGKVPTKLLGYFCIICGC